MPENTNPLADPLWTFVVKWPEDELAIDPDLVCERCGETVCTVENRDTLATLVLTAQSHECTAVPVSLPDVKAPRYEPEW